MPKSEAFRRPTRKPIREILFQATLGRLPEEVTRDELFSWISGKDLVFADPEERRKQRGRGPDEESPYGALLNWLRSRREYGQSEPPAYAIDLLVSKMVPETLQHYYAAAIAIGQRWKAAQTRARWADEARRPETFARTLADNHAIAGDEASDANDRRLSDDLIQLLTSASERAQAEDEAARSDWEAWRADVETLRRILLPPERERSEIQWALQILAELSVLRLTSRLVPALSGLGHAPSDGHETDTYEAILIVALLELMGALDVRDRPKLDGRDVDFDRLLSLIERKQSLEFRRAEAEWARPLVTRYGTANPFEPYRPLGRAADEGLQVLFAENRMDRLGFESPYLREWRQWLTFSPSQFRANMAEEPAGREEVARWADSELKLGLLQHPSPRDPAALSQRLREQWIHWARNAHWRAWSQRQRDLRREGGAGKTGSDDLWTTERFLALVEWVRGRLEAMGYRIAPLTEGEKVGFGLD